MGTPERDIYLTGTLVDGQPTCTFSPATYARNITGIVVTNSVTSGVTVYKGSLDSQPIATSTNGFNNMLPGRYRIPAGQLVFVRWDDMGSGPEEATARVSWERVDNPLDDDNLGAGSWTEEFIRSFRVPNIGDNFVVITDTSEFPPSLIAAYAGVSGDGLVSGIIYWNGDVEKYGYICLVAYEVDDPNDSVAIVVGVGSEADNIVTELITLALSIDTTGQLVFGPFLIPNPTGNPVGYFADGGGAEIPARVETSRRTASSAAFTAETVVDTITASLQEGITYRISHTSYVASSVADGYCRMRIREDDITGTSLVLRQQPTTIAANQSAGNLIEAEYDCAADESKTFVVTYVRQAGTGNLTATAAADNPVYTYVDRIRIT